MSERVIIPAQPGFEVVVVYPWPEVARAFAAEEGSDAVDVERWPVIAWEASKVGLINPITPDDSINSRWGDISSEAPGWLGLLYPGGQVVKPWGTTHHSLKAFVEECRASAERATAQEPAQ